MKKTLAIMIAIVLSISIAYSESQDYSSLSFDDLQTMKNAIDMEYYSRPESSGVLLNTGKYIVGEQIKPGQYYIAMTKPNAFSSSGFIRIYENADSLAQEEPNYHKLAKFYSYMFLYSDAISVLLEKGNIFVVDEGSVLLKTSPFKETDYYIYNPPEGTLVPKGHYLVGTEVPEGEYVAYPATTQGGELAVFTKSIDEDGEEKTDFVYGNIYLSVKQEIDSQPLILKEGEILQVSESIILAKKPMLQFD